jgi:alpha-tubulin suppressor-like RCC1 family protein
MFQSITSAEAHSCGVTIQGVAYCWGANGSRQLGASGYAGLDGIPYPVKVRGQ